MAGRDRRGLGKIAALSDWLEGHAEAVEADLLRYYRVDLADLFRGRFSYRRLWVLVNRLPQESWTQTQLRDEMPTAELVAPSKPEPETFGPWALVNYQLASILDAVRRVEYLTAVVGQVTPKREPPEPTPRPGLIVRTRPRLTADERAYLNSIRAKGG